MSADLSGWMDAYLDVFAACGRGEGGLDAVVEYYDPPVLLTTDDVSTRLATEGDVLAWAQGQVDGMMAAGFDRIEVLDLVVEPLNGTTSLVRGRFVRRRRDGSEISRIDATYLVVVGDQGPRIAALAVVA
jgi:hypothetical protein